MTDTQPGAVSRRQARRAAFVLTYQLDVRAGSDIEELSARYLADTGMEVPEYTREVVEGVQRDRLAIDGDVDAAAAGWTSDRLGAVERSILRLATWELRQGELPAAVIIDEAMELAKRYAGAEAAPFVNGVLGAIARGGGESR
jgi:transcription antitermination protein NusB